VEARLAGVDASRGDPGSRKDPRESNVPMLSVPTATGLSKSALALLVLLVTVGFHPNAGNEVVL